MSYPKVNRNGSGTLRRRTCQWCRVQTTNIVTIERSIFRGDDDVLKICKACSFNLTDAEILAGPPDHTEGGR